MTAIWLLGGSYLAMSAALILVGVWEARQVDKPTKGKRDARMANLLHRRCENPYCTHYFKALKTTDEECRYCSYVLVEMCLEEVIDMVETREAELQIKRGDMKMALRYSDLLRQFLPGGLKHEEAIMLAMIERRNNGHFTWHPTGEYTLPVSEDNVLLREQREFWRKRADR